MKMLQNTEILHRQHQVAVDEIVSCNVILETHTASAMPIDQP